MATKSLHDRIESYYDSWKLVLPPRMPICIRCDGRAFSRLTRRCIKPYDPTIARAMETAAIALCKESGAAIGYTQSDEITVLLTPYRKFASEPWFGGELEKLVSASATVCADIFKDEAREYLQGLSNAARIRVGFDARVGVFPRDDVANVFVDRQQDGRRNAILGLAQKEFGHKSIHGQDCRELVSLLRQREAGRLLDDQGFMNGRAIFPMLEKASDPATGDFVCKSRWVSVPAPDFKVDKEYFDEYIWPQDEEGTEAQS